MKKIKIVLIVILILIPAVTKSYETKVNYDSLMHFSTLHGMDKWKDTIALFGTYKDLPGFFSIPQIGIFDGENWNKLPNLLDISDSSSYLLISPDSRLHFDSAGNLWLSGRSLYKYENNQWKEFYIDDEYKDYRRFGQFTIDKNNNIWITTTIVSNKLQLSKGELYKFDGLNFQLILETKSSLSFSSIGIWGAYNLIVTLPNNKILVQRKINKFEEGKLDDMNDLYFYNQDGTYTTEFLQTASGPKYDSSIKVVSQIYPENENKIWFCLNTEVYVDHPQYNCCSGISLFDNGVWYPFDSSNNLKRVEKTTYYVPIYKIIKLNNENYFAFGYRKVYRFSEDYKLHEIPLIDILNSSKFIVFNEAAMKDTVPLDNSTIIGILKYKDNELWILYAEGILIFNPMDYMTVNESERNDQSSLYPNPASEIIHIGTNISFDSYIIYNMYGSYINDGTNERRDIGINNYPAGLYIIQFYQNGKITFTKNFIKVN